MCVNNHPSGLLYKVIQQHRVIDHQEHYQDQLPASENLPTDAKTHFLTFKIINSFRAISSEVK